MNLAQLTIFGAGLIGGSLALGAREKSLARHIVAIDLESEPVDKKSPFHTWIHASDKRALEQALSTSSLTVLCVPVRTIMKVLPEVLRLSAGTVTDCGSTKAAIASSLDGAPHRERFVAGHPMAGRPQGGLENAHAELFVGRKWILCPDGSNAEALTCVREFVSALGAEVMELTADEHDRSVAVTSHVPQVMASALAAFAQDAQALQAAGPGFASATRVAGGAESMWRDIFDTNGSAIGKALVAVGRELQTLGEELQQAEVEGTLRILEKARSLREDAG